jgi:predicted transposase YdaD
MTSHDTSYKLLFSHPKMVEDLLRGFVREAWVDDLDFGSLEKVSGSFVSDDLRDREDDVIWRLRWGQGWLYVYLLLEFQSTVDRYMAVRIMTYLGLLYQELIRGKKLSPTGLLPPVLPVVLYNGERRWNAPQDIQELVERVPGGLEHYLPQLAYLLLDEGAIDETALLPLRNLAAALFRLEKSRDPAVLGEVVKALNDWVKAPEQSSLRRSFTVWISRVLLRGRMPGVVIPELNDLQELNTMLAERVIEWTEEWKQQGLQQGLLQGRQEGRQEGRQQGETALLERLLSRRFGPLSAETRNRLASSTLEQLGQWADNILDAKSLEDVFASH